MIHILHCSLPQTLFWCSKHFCLFKHMLCGSWPEYLWPILIWDSIIRLWDCRATELGNCKGLCPYFTPFYFSLSPCTLILISYVSSGLFRGFFWLVGWLSFFLQEAFWFTEGLAFSFSPQTYVKLNRCIKVNIFISSISFLLLYTFPLFIVSNPVLLILSSCLSHILSSNLYFPSLLFSFLIYL